MKKITLKNQTGASVVETLIVIVIIAIIAVILVIIINPAEQIRKANDNRKMALSREISAAITRYQISHNTRYPWNVRTDTYMPRVKDPGNAFDYDPTDPDQSLEWIWELANAEELKDASVQTILKQNSWYVLKPQGTGDYPWVCFVPEAQANIQKAATNCDNKASAKGRLAPKRIRQLEPCDTVDGTIPNIELGERNLLCFQD